MTDTGGLVATAHATINIVNVAPSAELGNDGPVAEGGDAIITFSNASDPSSADRAAGLRYAFACDGTRFGAASTTPEVTCAFDDGPRTYTVRARVLDRDGDATEYATDVEVFNVAPTASLLLPQLVVLCALSYWLVLPFHWFLCWEGGPGLCPGPGLRVVGPVMLVLLLALLGWPGLRAATRQRLALYVLGGGALVMAWYAIRFAWGRSGPDFFIHWRAAFDLHLGRPLYKLDEIRRNHFGHAYKLPPFYILLLLPFATADDQVVLSGHRVLNVALLVATAGLLAQLARGALGWRTAIVSVAVVVGLMQPAYDTIAFGQTDILLLFLLVVVVFGLRSRTPWLVGVPLAGAISFKVYPALLLGVLVLRREWRALGWTMLGLVLANGIAVAFLGWQNHVIWLTEVLPSLGGGTSWIENQTINGFLSRLFLGTLQLAPIHDPWLDGLTYGSFLLIAGSSFVLLLPDARRDGSRFLLQYSSVLVVLVLAVPATWIHYSTITILPFIALIWHAGCQRLSVRQACAVALAFSLIAYGNQWTFFTGARHPGLPALALSYKGYGLAVLWCVLVSTLWPLLRARLASIAAFRKRAPLGLDELHGTAGT